MEKVLMKTVKEKYLETSDKMMLAGKKALSDSNTPDPFKELIRREMKNQQDLMEAMEWEKEE